MGSFLFSGHWLVLCVMSNFGGLQYKIRGFFGIINEFSEIPNSIGLNENLGIISTGQKVATS